jgi:hypothetical protein
MDVVIGTFKSIFSFLYQPCFSEGLWGFIIGVLVGAVIIGPGINELVQEWKRRKYGNE